MQLVFASNNLNKLEQVKLLLDNDKVLMPKDVGIDNFDVIEDGSTLKENAFKKAYALYKLSLIHISEPTRLHKVSRMPSSA